MKAERMAKQRVVYQLKIRLQGTKPAIWRRVQVPASVKLSRLHDIIQAAMGWTNSMSSRSAGALMAFLIR